MEGLESALSTCDRERLHEIGAIQRIGWLVGVELKEGGSGLGIVALSENLADVPWILPTQDLRGLVGKDLQELLDKNAVVTVQQVMLKDLQELLDKNAVVTVQQLIKRFQVFAQQQQDASPRGTLDEASPAACGAKSFGALRMLCKGTPLSVCADGTWSLCCSVVAANEGVFLLELEDAQRSIATSIPNADVLLCGDIMGRVRAGTSILSTAAAFCDAVMDVLPLYDRGMVYRFRDDVAGEVIYEKIRAGTIDSSYAGLRFPAGDIPVPARRLFMLNGLRLIHDTSGRLFMLNGLRLIHDTSGDANGSYAEAKRLVMLNGQRLIHDTSGMDKQASGSWADAKRDKPVVGAALKSGEKLDLSMCSLRAVSKVHVAYLRNMGVTASMSIAIVVNEELWGLYVFHSYTSPVSPSVEQRIMVEMVASISAVRIDGFIREQYVQRKLNLMSALGALAESPSIFAFFDSYAPALLAVLDIDAIVVCEGNDISASYGDKTIAPSAWGLRELNKRCGAEQVLLLSAFSSGLNGDGAGVAFLKMKRLQLALVRASHRHDVKWGGNPDVAKLPFLDGQLQPRRSFEMYLEKGRMESKLQPRRSVEMYLEKGRMESKAWSAADSEVITVMFDYCRDFLHAEMLRSFELSLERSNHECMESHKAAQENYEYFAHMSHELRMESHKAAQENYKYFAHMSHELQTPFHGVMGSLQLLLDASDKLNTAECRDIVTGALDCGDALLRTLNDILAVAKNKYKMALSMEAFSTAAMLSDAYSVMKPFAMQKGIRLSIRARGRGDASAAAAPEPAEPGAAVRAERPLLDIATCGRTHVVGDLQVVQNLLNNAIKFTPNGGSVTACMRDVTTFDEACNRWRECAKRFDHSYWAQAEGEVPTPPHSWTTQQCASALWYCLEVEDTGPGVGSHDDLLSSGVSKTHQGTGLGLHICLSHAKKHGGALGVASSAGKGTLFYFAVPLLPVQGNLEGGRTGTPSGSLSESRQGVLRRLSGATNGMHGANGTGDTLPDLGVKNPTVFIVDDSRINVRLCERKLALVLGEGVRFLSAMDGDQAVSKYEQILEAGEPVLHAILMDYHMPRMSGKDAILRIRAVEKERGRPNVPIAAYTADLSDVSKAVLLNAGASVVIPKPTPAGLLETTIQQMVGQFAQP
ncbi:hypothetical protein JKP88DRAFT_276511 [Tribonema minus]|uniref:histidine kinase n=1 Tax=Tribonema minus TaxID=303371 RepID=A0A836CHX5_9STRA|nr:hypothetical protein JKP88DRAFT_276511 [Tribonema minus]